MGSGKDGERFIEMFSGRSPLTSGFVCMLEMLSREADMSMLLLLLCACPN